MELETVEMDWMALVDSRNKWIEHNFPNPSMPNPGESLLGVLEELGELAHSHLKAAQKIRGTDEEHVRAGRDAIGDTTIYLLGVMSHYRVYPVNTPINKHEGSIAAQEIFHAVAALGALVDPSAAINRTVAGRLVSRIVMALRRYCHVRGWDYYQIVRDTWDHVSRRDWIAYPENGLPPVEE